MKVNKRQLRRIIKEERKRLNEVDIAGALASQPNATVLIEVGPNEFYEPVDVTVYESGTSSEYGEILVADPSGDLQTMDAEEAEMGGIDPAPGTYIILRLPA